MPHVLVVDDDPAATQALAHLLRDDGHHVSAFTSPAEALKALEQYLFDIVITDLEMPEVDGHAIMRAACRRHPDACVVVVTARPSQHAAVLLDAGACIVADKPLDYRALMSIVETCRARPVRERHAGSFIPAVQPWPGDPGAN